MALSSPGDPGRRLGQALAAPLPQADHAELDPLRLQQFAAPMRVIRRTRAKKESHRSELLRAGTVSRPYVSIAATLPMAEGARLVP